MNIRAFSYFAPPHGLAKPELMRTSFLIIRLLEYKQVCQYAANVNVGELYQSSGGVQITEHVDKPPFKASDFQLFPTFL